MRTLRPFAAMLAAVFFVPFGAPRAYAQTVLLKTNYPAVVVEAGKSVRFDIDVVTSSPRRVDLAVAELPAGWQATLRGGGFVIDGVFGDPENPPDVELEVRVPADAPPGPHQVVLRGTSRGITDTLPLTLRVGEAAAGEVALTTDFPVRRGDSDATFTFRLTLENNTPEETTFNLESAGPRGWQVSARPTAETQAATVTVEGGATSDVEVSVDPPDNVEAGEYPVRVQATGAEGRSATAELTVEITGTTRMELTTGDERLNVEGTAGRTREVTMVVRNNGTAPLRGVSLSATPPTDWEVTFEPEAVEQVEPGREQQVTARIVPAGDAVAGDYTLTISASGAEGASESVELRFTVQTSRFWGFVGLLVIVGALIGLRWVFQRYGRR